MAGGEEGVGVHLGAGAPPAGEQLVVRLDLVLVHVVPDVGHHEPDIRVVVAVGLAVLNRGGGGGGGGDSGQAGGPGDECAHTHRCVVPFVGPRVLKTSG
ncbi:hypothetical protein [Ornithinimicrobium kibberense]|uniref:hypothetical protein n=1 Tax=Ornithinimicrobium kibberense TaxID=282060 RepID=UPI0036152D25